MLGLEIESKLCDSKTQAFHHYVIQLFGAYLWCALSLTYIIPYILNLLCKINRIILFCNCFPHQLLCLCNTLGLGELITMVPGV